MKQHDLFSGTRLLQLAGHFRAGLLAGLMITAMVLLCAGNNAAAAAKPAQPKLHSDIEKKLGIEIVGLRRSAAGYMLDFRYRLLDPVKAAPLLDRKLSPYLLDEATGAELRVPTAPKVGQLRPTSRNKIIPGRNYYILFANPGRYLKAGSRVSLVSGDALIKHLTVE